MACAHIGQARHVEDVINAQGQHRHLRPHRAVVDTRAWGHKAHHHTLHCMPHSHHRPYTFLHLALDYLVNQLPSTPAEELHVPTTHVPTCRSLYMLLNRYEALVGAWRGVGDAPHGSLYKLAWTPDSIELSKMEPGEATPAPAPAGMLIPSQQQPLNQLPHHTQHQQQHQQQYHPNSRSNSPTSSHQQQQRHHNPQPPEPPGLSLAHRPLFKLGPSGPPGLTAEVVGPEGGHAVIKVERGGHVAITSTAEAAAACSMAGARQHDWVRQQRGSIR